MNRLLMLYIAAALILIAGIGHTVGTFMTVPPEQTAMHATIATMKATMVPMPVGAARSYMQILDGNNLVTCIFLILFAAKLLAIAKLPSSPATNRVITITAIGMAAFAMISATHFFAVPTVLTGVAAALCVAARFREREACS